MKLHYFDDPQPDISDGLRRMAIDQGYVPKTCLLVGRVIMGLVTKQGDPCKGCNGPRDRCHGRPIE